MSNTGIFIIVVGVVLVTIIICVTNFLCNYYNDWKDEKIKDARKAVIDFERAHIKYQAEANISVSGQNILDFIDTLKKLL